MNPTDLADATARGLDLLPPGDAARSDPRLLRDPELAEEARLTRETAAAVWLAVSPLCVAPSDLLQTVMAEIHPLAPATSLKPRRYLTWLAVSGWAAAAAIAISLWPQPLTTPAPSATKTTAQEPQARREIVEKSSAAPVPTPRDVRLRGEVARLQKRLATLRDDSAHRTPRVMSLTAPGAVRRTQEEAQQRVRTILTNALRSTLEAASASPSDPASLVIERGWLPSGLTLPEDGGVIRHRHFPEQAWQELGLSRAANGDYYDASSNIVWSADPEGRGFIGRKITGDDEVARFTKESDPITAPPKTRAAPEGFIIENPVDHTTEIFVENLPELPAGKQLIVRLTDEDGRTTDIPLALSSTPPVLPPVVPAPVPASDAQSIPEVTQIAANTGDSWPLGADQPQSNYVPFSTGVSQVLGATTVSAAGANAAYFLQNTGFGATSVGRTINAGLLFLNVSNSSIPAGFQLLQADIVLTGQPPTIIVEGGP